MSTDFINAPWACTPPPPVRWRSWQLRENLWASAGVLVVVLGTHALTGRFYLVVFALAVLAASLWRFFLPVTFELNSEGVSQWILGRYRRTPWTAIRRCEVSGHGVLLLPRADRCPMDVVQGLFLPWGGRREEILVQLRHHLLCPFDE